MKIFTKLTKMNTELEIWKDLPGYEGKYMVSSFGNVKSLNRVITRSNGIKQTINGKILNPHCGAQGYYIVNIERKLFTVHSLVAMAFLGHVKCRFAKVIDHINSVKTDNRLSNLQITTMRYNSSKDKKGTSKYTGVSWCKVRKKWQCYIEINGKGVYLGHFINDSDAADAYNKKLLEIT